jgi:hypothetical protein
MDFYIGSLAWSLVHLYRPDLPTLFKIEVLEIMGPAPAFLTRIDRGMEPYRSEMLFFKGRANGRDPVMGGGWFSLMDVQHRSCYSSIEIMGMYASRESAAGFRARPAPPPFMGFDAVRACVFLAVYEFENLSPTVLKRWIALNDALDAADWDPRRVEDDCVHRALRFVEYRPLGSGGSGSGGVRVYTVGRAVEEDRDVTCVSNLAHLRLVSVIFKDLATVRVEGFSCMSVCAILDYLSDILMEVAECEAAGRDIQLGANCIWLFIIIVLVSVFIWFIIGGWPTR